MPSIKRRHFILGSVGAAGALVIGWLAAPERRRLIPSTPLAAAPGETALNGWVKVSADNTVTVVAGPVRAASAISRGAGAPMNCRSFPKFWGHASDSCQC